MFAHSVVRFASVGALLIVSCAPAGPRPIPYGQTSCDFCRMTVSDERFGSEFVLAHGKIKTFDSIECLAGYVAAARASGTHGDAFVTDFNRPGTLIQAELATFLRATSLHSPMGRGLVAVPAGSDVAGLAHLLGAGAPLSWADVLLLVKREQVRA